MKNNDNCNPHKIKNIISLLLKEKRKRIIIITAGSFLVNLLYALYNGFLGIYAQSVWFITMGIYYAILSCMRFIAIQCEYNHRGVHRLDKEQVIMKADGILLFLLAFVLTGSICLSLKYDLYKKYNEIIMITIATYTFYRVISAIVNFIKSKKNNTPLIMTIRNIGICDALVSLLSLEKSMYATFGDENGNSYIMTILTGAGVCASIILIGISMIRYKIENI